MHSPVQWAAELGVKLLLESHGRVPDTIDGMAAVLDKLGHPETVGICLDTGNSRLGGAESLHYVKTFRNCIGHIHWNDMPKEMEAQRGKVYGCSMGGIPLGDGGVGIPAIVNALNQSGFNGATTL